MKTPTTALILGILSSLAPITQANPGGPHPPPPFRGGNNSAPEPQKPQIAVVEEELGIARDKFETYRKLTFEGFRYYVKSDETLRATHAAIYQKIQNNTLNERLTVTQARAFVLQLLEISSTHVEAPNPALTADNLDALSKNIDTILLEKVEGGILTPDLNRREWLMDELVHFAADSSVSDSRRSSLVNRLEDLLAAEDRAKESGDLSDNERDKLLENSVDTWKAFVRVFRK
ncbi:hypothetical protein JIN84_04390 [Luteolibacter yonseiensis]|uniref:Uncharacterized protein n=1 Tax=Luteolibacter yonseiensis TaxID=1144680 RepID=A0A934R3Y5_9BACT|nr:hypothetical protein [Luteolibacter yonseiensis]MBK1814840.1 hypothetical protein [Luteolibacter yonseiensis]